MSPYPYDYSRFRQVSLPHEIQQGQLIANAYNIGYVNAWPGEYIAKSEFYLLATSPQFTRFFVPMSLSVQDDGKMMLFQCTRKILGKDTKNYPQQIGDCVSFGAKNAIEYLICVQSVMGTPSQFRPIFPPYLYGCGRVFIGKGRIRPNEDGSLGSWQAQAVQEYGTIASDEKGVPEYSGKVAKQWGGSGPPKEYVEIGKQHPVKSAAQMNSWNDVVTAVTNGYPCTIASNQGFQMEPDQSGFHNPKGSWGHQMSIIGVDNKHGTPYAIILNSWGDVHGHLKDFETQEDLPVGTLRVRAETIEKMVGQGDTFAYSHLDWFQEQKLARELFKLI